MNLLKVVQEHHRGREPPLVSVQEEKATLELFQEVVCRLDWRLFDSATLSWRFDGNAYVERLKDQDRHPA